MALYSRSVWHDGDAGDDLITRQTVAARSGRPVVASSHVPSATGSLRPTQQDPAYNGPPVTDHTNISAKHSAKVVSQESGIAPFETLFTEFGLQAIPFYNFWEQDEESNGTLERGRRELVDMPRFVKLSWTPAPDLKDPDEFQKRALQGRLQDARDQFVQLSPFGFGAHQIVGHTAQGLAFSPESLQPEHFRENVAKCANGYIAAGIVEAVVSMETGTVVPPPAPTSHLVDEDSFLRDHTRWEGISFSELNSSLWRRRSTAYGIQQSSGRSALSSEAARAQAGLFSGQYGLNPYLPGTNGHILASHGSSGPSISYYGHAASGGRANRPSRVEELAEGLVSSPPPSARRFHNVRTKLIHTNFSGLLDPQRVAGITQPHQAESTVAVAQNAADLAAYAASGLQHTPRTLRIPSDRVPDTIKPLEYVGYVIEKWEQVDGAYRLSDTLYAPGRRYTEFYDTRVRYGADYRYRIRSVIRWSRPHGSGVLGPDLSSQSAPGSDTDSLVPNDASYFYSEWGDEWAYAQVIDRSPPNPPDEFRVRPVSAEKYIEVTFKLPDNPQRDINRMSLYRKLQDSEGRDITGWVRLQEFREDLSDPSRQGTRVLFEDASRHEQDDITGTKFRAGERARIERFVEYGPTNARFEDHGVEFYGENNSYRYVYAAVCFTRHGEESLLSDQLSARLNSDWKRTGEFLVEFVSCAGVNRDLDTGVFSTYPERRIRSEVIAIPDLRAQLPAHFDLAPQVRLALQPLQSSSYVIRVESLDNGQRVDIPLSIKVNNRPEQVQQLPYAALVPSEGR